MRRLLAAIAAAGLLLPAAAPAFEIIEDEIVSVDAGRAEVAAPEPERSEAKVAEPEVVDAVVAEDATPETDVLNEAAVQPVELETVAYDLYLAIFINGMSRHVVVAVHREPDGSLWMLPADLTEAGIATPKGQPPDERVALAELTDVTYVFDEAQQSIDFTAAESARARLIIDANGDDVDDPIVATDADTRPGDFGIVLNYDLFAAASMDDKGIVMSPLSGAFEARAFGPFGLVEQTFALLTDPLELRRLNTTWSFSDPGAMRTYRAGDIVTGALSWTRPTRLGGVQVQNDFGLRSDVITYPVPSISGTAALPSAVDIYVNDANRYSGEVPEGPFEIVDVPVLTGAGTIELVVQDAAGNKVSTKADYFSSPRLLRPGLIDYSAEVGVARTHFGTPDDRYDDRLMASASIRTGVTDWLTWEGHAEGGLEMINAGMGATVALGRLGLGQFSIAGSRTPDATGVQVAGSLQLSFGRVNVGARAQKSFGRFEDIASFTAPGVTDPTEPTPSSVYQLSLSLPTPFEGGRANLSYTQLERATGESAQILAAGYGQKVFAGTGSATAYADLSTGRYGMTMSLWMPLGNDISTRASVRHTDEGTSLMADIGNSGGNEVGDVNWLLRVNQNDRTEFSAMARTKTPVASLRTRVVHRGDRTNAGAQLSGSVIAAGGGLHLANPVTDAFAVVDVGAPGIPVLYQNRLIGVTGKDGKLVVPGLAAYEKNRISIDPTNLPLDSVVDNTTAIVIPARGAGVTVTFGSKTEGGTALVSFVDEDGNYLPLASTGSAAAGAPEFVVGYDGAALLEGLAAENIVTITLPDGSACIADVPFVDAGGELVDIPDVVCHAA